MSTKVREAFARVVEQRRELVKERNDGAAKLREAGALIAAEYAKLSKAGVRVHGPSHGIDQRKIALDKMAIKFLQGALNRDADLIERYEGMVGMLLAHCADLETKLAEASTAGQPG